MSQALKPGVFSEHRKLLQVFNSYPRRSSVELEEEFPNHVDLIRDLNNAGIRIHQVKIGRLIVYKLHSPMEVNP